MNLINTSIHILIGPNTRQDWLDQCRESLRPSGVQVIESEHIEGNLTIARLNAFKKQQTEFVGWVDPDDLIPIGGMEALMNSCSPGVGLVTGDEEIINEWGQHIGYGSMYGKLITAKDIVRTPTAAHKGFIHRSAISLAEKICGDDPFGIDAALVVAATLVGTVVKIPQITYRWRHYSSQCHRHNTTNYQKFAKRYETLIHSR